MDLVLCPPPAVAPPRKPKAKKQPASHRCPVCGVRTRRKRRWTGGHRDDRCQRCATLRRWAKQHVRD